MAVIADDVREIIVGDTAASDGALNFWISWADGVLDRAEELAGTSYDTSDREILQRLIAAHGVQRQPSQVSVGQTSQRFPEEPVGKALAETKPGRDALAYDPLDVLENVGKKVPTFEGYGTTYDASEPEL